MSDAKNAVHRICVGKPSSFTENEIDDFTAFVLAGGEVSAKGLRDRVAEASQLAVAREKECLLGVAGLKIPEQGYRNRIEQSANVRLAAETLPFELGWVFIMPSARGRNLSAALCAPLVTLAEGRGIFATSRTNNIPMHRTLERLGFRRLGQEWPSKENDANLELFIKDAV